MRRLVLLSPLALLSACVVRAYDTRPAPVVYQQPVAVQPAYFQYNGPHPVPDSEGGGWCPIEGVHSHPYAPDAEYRTGYRYEGTTYVYAAPRVVWYYGFHPTADGGYCYLQGRHAHPYLPPPAMRASFVWSPGVHYYRYHGAYVPPGVHTAYSPPPTFVHTVQGRPVYTTPTYTNPNGPPPGRVGGYTGSGYAPPPPPGGSGTPAGGGSYTPPPPDNGNPPPGHGGQIPGHGGTPPGWGHQGPPGHVNNPGHGGDDPGPNPPGHGGGWNPGNGNGNGHGAGGPPGHGHVVFTPRGHAVVHLPAPSTGNGKGKDKKVLFPPGHH